MSAFAGSDEGLMAFSVKNVSLHDWIRVRLDGELLLTTPGRVIMNQTLPIGRAARESDDPDVVVGPLTFQNTALDKKGLRILVARLFTLYGGEVTATVVSDIKRIGYHYANQAGSPSRPWTCRTRPPRPSSWGPLSRRSTRSSGFTPAAS